MSTTTADQKVIPQLAKKEASEWWFVAATIVFVLAITTAPYLYAYLTAPPDRQFMGIMLDVPDHVQYFSWMRELTSAHLSANKLTPEPNRPVFFNLLWWGLGRIGYLMGLDYHGTFQLLRFAAGTLFLLLTYRLCAWFLPNRLMRRTAFLVTTFSSGFGWVLILLKYTVTDGVLLMPLNVFIAEGNTFLGILGYPHFIGAALYIFVFDLILRGQTRGQLRYAVAAGLVALFFGWQHAYDLVLVYGILGSYTVLTTLRDRRLPFYLIKSGLIIGLISWWPALYSVLLTSLDPLWEEVLAQFANADVFTPNLLQLPILMGPTFLLACFTVIRQNPLRLKQFDDKNLFLMAWFLANFLLIYIPTDYQIHMLNGWQVPIAILATQGLFCYIFPIAAAWFKFRSDSGSSTLIRSEPATLGKNSRNLGPTQNILVIALLLIIIPTNVYLWLWRFVDLSRADYPYFLHREEVKGLDWLEDHANTDDVVFSGRTVGQYIPALTGTHAFLAHWAQTLDYYGKSEAVEYFFSEHVDDAWRQDILKQFSVDYVFYGPAERELGDYDLESAPFLEQVYKSSRVRIFEVKSQ